VIAAEGMIKEAACSRSARRVYSKRRTYSGRIVEDEGGRKKRNPTGRERGNCTSCPCIARERQKKNRKPSGHSGKKKNFSPVRGVSQKHRKRRTAFSVKSALIGKTMGHELSEQASERKRRKLIGQKGCSHRTRGSSFFARRIPFGKKLGAQAIK